MQILDECRDYLQSSTFETAWNVARTMIEAYPLAGVLGTICAIGAALAGPDGGSVSTIVARFGDAIWSTFAGLSAAIVLMLIHRGYVGEIVSDLMVSNGACDKRREDSGMRCAFKY